MLVPAVRVKKACLPAATCVAQRPFGKVLRSLSREGEATGRVVSSTDFGMNPKRAVIRELGHDLRTPLNAIIGFSEMILSGAAGDVENERQREYLEYVRKSGADLLDTVSQLLEEKDRDQGFKS